MARNRIHDYLDRERIKKTEELLPYDLGDELVGALLKANLAEPLDSPEFDDVPEAQKQQMREAG